MSAQHYPTYLTYLELRRECSDTGLRLIADDEWSALDTVEREAVLALWQDRVVARETRRLKDVPQTGVELAW